MDGQDSIERRLLLLARHPFTRRVILAQARLWPAASPASPSAARRHSACAVSSTLNPPKNRNSITLARRASIRARFSSASSSAQSVEASSDSIVAIRSRSTPTNVGVRDSATPLDRRSRERLVDQNPPHHPAVSSKKCARSRHSSSLLPTSGERARGRGLSSARSRPSARRACSVAPACATGGRRAASARSRACSSPCAHAVSRRVMSTASSEFTAAL